MLRRVVEVGQFVGATVRISGFQMKIEQVQHVAIVDRKVCPRISPLAHEARRKQVGAVVPARITGAKSLQTAKRMAVADGDIQLPCRPRLPMQRESRRKGGAALLPPFCRGFIVQSEQMPRDRQVETVIGAAETIGKRGLLAQLPVAGMVTVRAAEALHIGLRKRGAVVDLLPPIAHRRGRMQC